MVLTVEEATSHILDTLATDELPAVGAMRILNNAGAYLCNCHQWLWLVRPSVKLHFEEDQDYVWLPRDFRDLLGYDVTQGLGGGLRLTTFQHIVELRTKTIASGTWVDYAAIAYKSREERATGSIVIDSVPADGATITIGDGLHTAVVLELDIDDDGVSAGQSEVDAAGITTTTALAEAIQDHINTLWTDATYPLEVEAVIDADDGSTINLRNRRTGTLGNVTLQSSSAFCTLTGMSGGADPTEPLPRLELWPTPTADLEDAFTIYYRAGWLTMHEDDDRIPVPEWLEAPFLSLVRAYARGYHREDVEPLEARLARVRMGPDMQAAIQRDSQAQPDFGPLRNGQFQRVGIGPNYWNFTSTSDPS